jgi:hypothetical protein
MGGQGPEWAERVIEKWRLKGLGGNRSRKMPNMFQRRISSTNSVKIL